MSLTEEEGEALLKSVAELGIKPKAGSVGDLKKWMAEYVYSEGLIESELGAAAGGLDGSGIAPSPSSVHITQPPRISQFSGDPAAKGEADFDLWLYEVSCLLKEAKHPEHVLSQAIRRSLRGHAAKVAMGLGHDSSIGELIGKFTSVFGSVEEGEDLLASFYSASQRESEDVSAWACRLEAILHKASQQGQVVSNGKEMLRKKFWSGLRQWLKDCSGHKFDTITDFDRLRVAIRKIEYDHQGKSMPDSQKVTAVSKMAQVESETQKELKDLKALVCNLTSRFDKYENRQAPVRYSSEPESKPTPPDPGDPRGPQCWKCFGFGHIARGCRVRLDHMRQGEQKLNK